METWSCIRTRRTTRQFRPQAIAEATVRRILEAGRLAPSALNRQPWHFVVVRDRGRLRELAEACMTGRFVGEAAFAVVVAVDAANRWHQIDAGRAVQQMELAGWDAGVGMCWIAGFDDARVRRLAGLEGERATAWTVLAVLAFGYPAHPGGPRRRGARKPFDEVVSWERFGQAGAALTS